MPAAHYIHGCARHSTVSMLNALPSGILDMAYDGPYAVLCLNSLLCFQS
jgi:hypothetical protein